MDSPEKSSNLCILTSNPKIIVALMQTRVYTDRHDVPEWKCRPPSQRIGNEMAVGISILILEFCIPGVRLLGGKIRPRHHPSGSD